MSGHAADNVRSTSTITTTRVRLLITQIPDRFRQIFFFLTILKAVTGDLLEGNLNILALFRTGLIVGNIVFSLTPVPRPFFINLPMLSICKRCMLKAHSPHFACAFCAIFSFVGQKKEGEIFRVPRRCLDQELVPPTFQAFECFCLHDAEN